MTRNHRTPTVEPHATNLITPSHMEWTDDGRLLVSEISAGTIKDITAGGDMRRENPFAEGLQSPAAIRPTEDYGILVAESSGASVRDISDGGDVSENEPFAYEVPGAYSLTQMKETGQILVTEERKLGDGGYETAVVDITEGGGREEHRDIITHIPRDSGPYSTDRGHPDSELGRECSTWQDPIDGDLAITVSAMGQVLRIRGRDLDEEIMYRELLEEDAVVASGLNYTRGIKYNDDDELIYLSEPYAGSVSVVSPEDHRNTRFDPPIVRGVGMPSCIRFGPGDELYVCDRSSGAVYKVTDYK